MADAWALRAILDLGKNDTAQALQYAEKAIQLGPQSVAAHLAHSYALQANRQTEAALASARRVVELAPERSLGYTRLAELELARGDSAAALQAAQRAEQINPKSADAKAMLGFVYLSQVKLKGARTTFESAIELNSADPRARMGLGLTRIRQGQLQAGREDLELAASLDPENPLLRTYLGRAYQEEGRYSKAAEQYARAKRADPQDPTPYFFGAILYATQNQAVSAAQEMQAALARNDNRAVYRGQALLEEDQDLRQANAVALDLALGFDDAALAEASRNVTLNPQSSIAHRAYGDALAALPRADAARRSEYLQAQLTAPVGSLAAPLFLSENVQRSGFEAPQHGFFRAVEPGQIGLNDYGAAFKTKPWQVQTEAIVGGQNTHGGQVQFSGSAGPVGGSISHLQFKTDGFGEFNRLDNSALRGILQADITASTRLMVEAQQFSSDRQDIYTPAEPFYFAPQAVSEDRYRYRVALRQTLAEHHEFLVSDIWENAKQITDYLPTDNVGASQTRFDYKSHQPEYQYRLKLPHFNATLGQRYGKTVFFTNQNPANRGETRSQVSYLYTALQLPYHLDLELGASISRVDSSSLLNQHKTSHKFGLRWEPITGGVLRLASFETVNDAFLNNATLEPTQLAGFHQAYNDNIGSSAYRRGIAWDQRLQQGFSWGVEASARDLQVPISDLYVPWDERQSRAYIAWAAPNGVLGKLLPGSEAALTLSYDHLHLTRSQDFTGAEEVSDYRLRQLRLGLTLKHVSGWSGNLGLSRVQTQGVFNVFALDTFDSLLLPIRDRFWSADAALSYQLPGKLGQISVGVLNAFDRRGFQYLELDTQNPRYAPQRLVYGKLQLSF